MNVLCSGDEKNSGHIELKVNFPPAAAEKGQGVCPLRGLGWNPKAPCRNTTPRVSEQPRSGYEANGGHT